MKTTMLGSFEKLKDSLSKTRKSLFGKIADVVSRRRLDDDLLDDIEEILIEADVGVNASMRLIQNVKDRAAERKITDGEEVFGILKEEIAAILTQQKEHPVGQQLQNKPAIWLIVGVNGVGKTTTIGKLAARFTSEGKRVIIAACDTFRTAAIEQVAIWAERGKVDIIKAQHGSDPGSVAFDAAKAAQARGADILLVDTAGRLHTKSNLMEELKKIRRVIGKALPETPIYSKLILDGSTGQNALSQVKVFTEAVGCDGLIVTKLDGTAKGGVMIAVAEELGVPVEYIGIGEGLEDLQKFEPEKFAEALLV